MEKIRYFGEWACVNGYAFNTQTKQLIDLKDHLISREFLSSKIFKDIVNSDLSKVYEKRKANQILALEITERCNYECRYCFEGNSSQIKNNSLSFQKACNAIDKLPNGSKLRFFGGEPLLEFDLIKDMVAKYPQHIYSIVTNGSLVTSEIASFLAEHKFSVGLSYDGYGWQKRNRICRNHDSQHDFENAIKLLSEAGVYVGISTVVTKESIPSLYDIHLEVFDDYPISGWAYLIGYTSDMTFLDLDIFRNNLMGIIEDFPARHLLKINDLRRWSMKVTGEWPIDGFCGAGACYKAITSQGEERFCPFFLREPSCYGPSIGLVEVNCKKCQIWNFCKGGCLALNLYGSGSTNKSHPFSCKKNHIYFEAGLRTRIKIREEIENPAKMR
ncbi:MAG: radical SAM protein [Candidatus Paceibacterota bacterium]|jgi:MoaA/NifB/PqqE/SkfB family radical SAM enzyme